jgi:hypothetical protein
MYKSRFFMQLSVFLFSLFLLGGCGANNSESSPNQAPDVPGVDSNTTSVTAKMTVYNGNNITASKDGEVLSITLQAFTKNDTPAEGKIVAQYIETDGKNGSLTPSSVDLSGGFANFTYTAPTNLQSEIDSGNTGTSFRFYAYSSEDELLSDVAPITVNITFDTTAIADDIGGNPIAQLLVSNGSGTITTSGESLSVTVLAKDSQGYPVKGGTVRVKYPANAVRVGLFSTDEVAVSTSGIATFTYTGPDPLSYGGASFTFEYKENPTYTVGWTVYFRPTVDPVDPVAPTYPIATIAATQDIIADTDGYTKTIEVLAFMSGNIPAPEGTVTVIYPADVATKNIGTFTPATADITDGKATFTYSGPAQLVADSDQIFTFRATDYPTVSDTVTVSYSPKIDPTSPVAQTINIVNDDDNNPANGKSIDITQNEEVINVRVRVFGADNNPFDGGNVKVQYPDVAVNGTAVGSFAALSVPCVNGVADFTYTAPKNINGRSDSFDFTFNHDSANSPASQSLTMVMNPSGTQIVLTNYQLIMAASDSNNTMGIKTSKTFTISVVDDNGDPLTQNATYTLTNDYQNMADITDTTGASASPTLNIVGINANFAVTTKTISGLLSIKASVAFTDANGNPKTLEEVFDVVVFSGPPTTFELHRSNNTFDDKYSQFTEHFLLSVSDEYGNVINTRPTVSMGAIVGYATSNPAAPYDPANYIYFQPNGTTTGTMDTAIDQFTTTNPILGNVDQNGNDKLVIIPPGYDYDAGGKWDFNYVSNNTLNLLDEFLGVQNVSGLGFAVGNNQRVRTCEIGAKENVTVSPSEGIYKLDENGQIPIDMVYRPYLVGKDVILWINVLGFKQADNVSIRTGTGRKFTLQGNGLLGASYTVPKGSLGGSVTFYLGQEGIDRQPYFNANFLSNAESTGDVRIISITRSAVTDCTALTPGQAWVTIVYGPTTDGGTITISPTVQNEIQ